jgi:hypothetical protein
VLFDAPPSIGSNLRRAVDEIADTLMFIDVVNAGWVPIYNLNLSEDVPGYTRAPATALAYPWTHFICGHLGRLATRQDVAPCQPFRSTATTVRPPAARVSAVA